MRLAVIGGTGRTGRLVVELAAREHRVRVLARWPVQAREALAPLGSTVEVVEGDLLRPASLRALLDDRGTPVEAVISAAGPVRGGGPSVMRQGAEHVVEAMGTAGISRLVWMTGAGVRLPQDRPGAADRAVVALMEVVARRALHDSRAAVAAVTASGLDWTVVRAPRLVAGDASSEPIVVDAVGAGTGMTVARATVARMMLGLVEHESWVREAPVVSD